MLVFSNVYIYTFGLTQFLIFFLSFSFFLHKPIKNWPSVWANNIISKTKYRIEKIRVSYMSTPCKENCIHTIIYINVTEFFLYDNDLIKWTLSCKILNYLYVFVVSVLPWVWLKSCLYTWIEFLNLFPATLTCTIQNIHVMSLRNGFAFLLTIFTLFGRLAHTSAPPS